MTFRTWHFSVLRHFIINVEIYCNAKLNLCVCLKLSVIQLRLLRGFINLISHKYPKTSQSVQSTQTTRWKIQIVKEIVALCTKQFRTDFDHSRHTVPGQHSSVCHSLPPAVAWRSTPSYTQPLDNYMPRGIATV